MASMNNEDEIESVCLLADEPIKNSSEDRLGRTDAARDFARSIRELDASEGLVIAVLGPWGSGKSSFINLMKEEFFKNQRLTIIDFNPWMFSGSQQLADFFFKELATSFRSNDTGQSGKLLSTVANDLDKYGDALSVLSLIPGFGGWFDRALKVGRLSVKYANDKKNEKTTVSTLRNSIKNELKKRTGDPIVIVIDDVDRLSTEEIRDMFKLVRITGSFPNLIYLMAFDRERVETALTEDNLPGRAYLEKIVQLAFDLPSIPSGTIDKEVAEELDQILADIPEIRLDGDRWPDVYFEILKPVIGNMRDVTRFAISARFPLNTLGADIEAVDLLAMEAIRVFRPDLFSWLQSHRSILTQRAPYSGASESTQRKEIEEYLEKIGADAELMKNLMERVFPPALSYLKNIHYDSGCAIEWRRAHRLADADFLNMYFNRVAPQGFTDCQRAEKACERIDDPNAFNEYLDSLDPADLEGTIANLGTYTDKLPQETIIPICASLLNRIGRMPKGRPRGIFDIADPSITVDRFVLNMLKNSDEGSREANVEAILEGLETYSSCVNFVKRVCSEKRRQDLLISAAFIKRIEGELARKIISGHARTQDKEWSLLQVYCFAADTLGEKYKPPTLSDADEIRLLFESARWQSRSQSFDTRLLQTRETILWDQLVRILGSEEAIQAASALLEESDGETPLVKLVKKYLAGWRPDEKEKKWKLI